MPGRVVDIGIFEDGRQGFGIRDLQDGESIRVEDPKHFFHGLYIFGDMFEDVVGDEDIKGARCEWKVGGVGVADGIVDVTIETRGDVYGSNMGCFVYKAEEVFFRREVKDFFTVDR